MKSAIGTRLAALAAAGFALAVASAAFAQGYPSRPIRLIVPFPPGGSSDVQARLVAHGLGERLGQTVIVENRPGASAIIGTDFVAKQPADGYTMLLAAPPFVITPFVQSKVPYDPRKDFVGVSVLTQASLVVAVGTGFPAKSFAELVAKARAEPGRVAYGAVGVGGIGVLGTELLARRLGIKLLQVPYKGSAPALTDLAGGQIAMMLTTPLDLASQLKGSLVRVLANTAPQRSPFLPDVPTLRELGFTGIDLGHWFSAIVMRSGTSPQIVSRLSSEIASVMKQPDLRAKLTAQSVEVIGSSAAECDEFLHAELAKTAEAVSIAGIKPN